MGGKGGGGKSTTTQTPTPPQIPPELAPWVSAAVANIIANMNNLPIEAFTTPNPQQIPNLSPTQMALINQQVSLPGQMAEALTGQPSQVPLFATLPTWQSQVPARFGPRFGTPPPPAPPSAAPGMGGPVSAPPPPGDPNANPFGWTTVA